MRGASTSVERIWCEPIFIWYCPLTRAERGGAESVVVATALRGEVVEVQRRGTQVTVGAQQAAGVFADDDEEIGLLDFIHRAASPGSGSERL